MNAQPRRFRAHGILWTEVVPTRVLSACACSRYRLTVIKTREGWKARFQDSYIDERFPTAREAAAALAQEVRWEERERQAREG